MVRVHLVNEYRTLLFTATGEMGSSVAIDIQLANHPSPLNGKLLDSGSHSLAVPRHFTRMTDVE
jgi:hypothetical protein